MTSFARMLFAALAATVAAPSAAATALEIVVPAYFYPSFSGSDWDRMTDAVASGVPVTAIMNPGSGPGTASNSDYVAAVSTFREAGGKVLGYVSSAYIGQQVSAGASCQPASGSTYTTGDVIACAGLYDAFYDIDGIFVDEMGQPAVGAPEADVLAFYQTVYDGIKEIDADWTITGNPGTNAPEGLLRNGAVGAADALITFENRASFFAGAVPAAYQADYDGSRFGALLLETGPGFDVRAAIALAASRNFGQIYFTDDVLPNPYDVLPSYWDEKVSAVRDFNAAAAIPEPGTWLMLITGFAASGLVLRRRNHATRSVAFSAAGQLSMSPTYR